MPRIMAFILFLKQQPKAAFDFSSSAGEDEQGMVGRGIAEPYSMVIPAFFLISDLCTIQILGFTRK